MLAVLLLAFALALRVRHTGTTEFGVDGSYYFQVARHVAGGDGLVTSADLYHQGLKRLPSQTNIYPLWPLLLGFAGRATNVVSAAHCMPQVIAIAALLLLYLLTIAVAREWRLPAAEWPFDVGHIAVILFAANPLFFAVSTVPYTEALAFVLLFAALLATGDDPKRATLAGACAGLAFLTRSQMIVVAVAIVLALAVRRRLASAVIACVAFVAVVAPWVVWLTTFVKPFTSGALISMYRETAAIPPYQLNVSRHGPSGILFDVLRGSLVAFDPVSPMSFVASFGVAALLVPLALVHWLARTRLQRSDRTVMPHTLATLLAGGALCAILLVSHQRFFLEWLFGYRHGLPFILLLVLAIVELLHGIRPIRVATLAVVAISVLSGAIACVRQAPAPHRWPPQRDAQLAAWLEHNDPNGIVLTTNAQVLSAISPANFRWVACDDGPGITRAMWQLVRTDYVAAYDGEQRCSFLHGLVGRDLHVIAVFGQWPERLFLMRPTPTLSAPPSTPGD